MLVQYARSEEMYSSLSMLKKPTMTFASFCTCVGMLLI